MEIFLPDVLLGDAEFLLDAQLDGQSVGVPSRLAVHEIALLRLVAADDVLDRAGHDVMDARHAVGRGGTFVKYECGVSLAGVDAFVECVAGVPFAEHFGGYAGQIETFILLELHIGKKFLRCFSDKQQRYKKDLINRTFSSPIVAKRDRAGVISGRERRAGSTNPVRRPNRRRRGRPAVRRPTCRSRVRVRFPA